MSDSIVTSSDNIVTFAYLVAAVLFVFALKAMSSAKTARRGNAIGAIGMAIAIVVTLLSREFLGIGGGWWAVVIAGAIGTGIGAFLALTVKMTGMPQMVAIFNGLGGLASAMVVFSACFRPWDDGSHGEMAVSIGVSTFIGWVTFTGSLIAFARLHEFVLSGRPTLFKMQKIINFVALASIIVLITIWGLNADSESARLLIIPIAIISAIVGVLFTIPIGGADMPVVISLLNSYSGLAACATGFVLQNPGLIIAGSLVGSSGIVLTRIMCVAMNRSLANVLFGGVGAVIAGPAGDDGGEPKRVTSWTPEDAAIALEQSQFVIIVPGYGMAVAQAQHAVKELSELLESKGIEVKFGIHEVAGRMPGHMNVLLAEAEVEYDNLLDRGEANAEMDRADAVIVLGANDVVNPVARHDKSSPIYGMPILDVDKAGTVMVIKRSLNPGFAGVDNELFYMDNTAMIFGDGKKVITAITSALRDME